MKEKLIDLLKTVVLFCFLAGLFFLGCYCESVLIPLLETCL
jgi:hypothetical protein